ncbi:MAG: thiamine pyrophosphate-dependent enzyme, partial [Actinomycetes bacterium]
VAAAQRPGAGAITLPQYVQAALTDAPAIGWHEPPRLGPAPIADVAAAARVLERAQLPVMLVGAGGSRPDVIGPLHAFLAKFPMPVAVTFQGAGSVAGEPEYLFLGRVGLFRNQPGDRFLADADVVLTVGYDAVEYDPAVWNLGHSKAIIHLDSIVAEWDRSYQPATELRGHIGATLTELALAVAGRSISPETLARIRADRPDLGRALHVELTDASLCNPRTVVAELRRAIPDDATVACDVGSNYIWMARHFRSTGPNQLLFSNGQQTLGVALPWAMAANFLGRRAVSVSGDGGFLFSAMELETATRNGLNLVHFVMRDNSYNMVAFQEQIKYGRTSGTDLGYYDIVGLAAAFGATGLRVQSERDLPAVIDEAMRTPGVVLVDIPVDYSHNVELAGHVIPEDWQ